MPPVKSRRKANKPFRSALPKPDKNGMRLPLPDDQHYSERHDKIMERRPTKQKAAATDTSSSVQPLLTRLSSIPSGDPFLFAFTSDELNADTVQALHHRIDYSKTVRELTQAEKSRSIHSSASKRKAATDIKVHGTSQRDRCSKCKQSGERCIKVVQKSKSIGTAKCAHCVAVGKPCLSGSQIPFGNDDESLYEPETFEQMLKLALVPVTGDGDGVGHGDRDDDEYGKVLRVWVKGNDRTVSPNSQKKKVLPKSDDGDDEGEGVATNGRIPDERIHIDADLDAGGENARLDVTEQAGGIEKEQAGGVEKEQENGRPGGKEATDLARYGNLPPSKAVMVQDKLDQPDAIHTDSHIAKGNVTAEMPTRSQESTVNHTDTSTVSARWDGYDNDGFFEGFDDAYPAYEPPAHQAIPPKAGPAPPSLETGPSRPTEPLSTFQEKDREAEKASADPSSTVQKRKAEDGLGEADGNEDENEIDPGSRPLKRKKVVSDVGAKAADGSALGSEQVNSTCREQTEKAIVGRQEEVVASGPSSERQNAASSQAEEADNPEPAHKQVLRPRQEAFEEIDSPHPEEIDTSKPRLKEVVGMRHLGLSYEAKPSGNVGLEEEMRLYEEQFQKSWRSRISKPLSTHLDLNGMINEQSDRKSDGKEEQPEDSRLMFAEGRDGPDDGRVGRVDGSKAEQMQVDEDDDSESAEEDRDDPMESDEEESESDDAVVPRAPSEEV
ncbi:hypothetical protein FFLO_06911 [Filobasidium floriforme]|uniref:Uncharacterized protein n=1 Tax=Filobasidium floriforme TaxID=5210 RepID=A0A8K0JFB7_9TREE|nr:uncharacterized protein HD553DRAFT_320672 [Filobasidium floriforme]KAG7527463.1 hypothetical protein FFLO_06911 [Filobasidium floriforme]KAH8077657.1 hypothetical protein HD553DRAFT_320672 [Filobasidium floriforme]